MEHTETQGLKKLTIQYLYTESTSSRKVLVYLTIIPSARFRPHSIDRFYRASCNVCLVALSRLRKNMMDRIYRKITAELQHQLYDEISHLMMTKQNRRPQRAYAYLDCRISDSIHHCAKESFGPTMLPFGLSAHVVERCYNSGTYGRIGSTLRT